MPLCTAQQELFRSAFLPLLAYANRRCKVVRDLPTADLSDDDNLRLELVARTLWHHIELIDDYVRDNPDGLSAELLAIARDLRGTLYGEYLFDGTCDGRAILVHDTGIYQALCLDDRAADKLPDHPCTIRCAIAPYHGHILLVKPLVVIGDASPARRASYLDTVTEKGLEKPVGTGEALAQRACSWHAHEKRRVRRQREQSRAGSIGKGYHRGALAGTSEDERAYRLSQHLNARLTATGDLTDLLASHATAATLFPFSLSEGLELLDTEWLEDLAKHFTSHDEATPSGREPLITYIVERASSDRVERDTALTWCEDGQFDLLSRLMHENPLSFMHLEPSVALGLYPMPPYTFLLHENDSFVAWMPPEIASLMSDADFDAVAQLRRRLAEVGHAADALASMCGIISLDEAYGLYHAAASSPFSRMQFELAVIEMEACERRDTYALWEHDETTYIISGELSEQGIMAKVLRTLCAEQIVDPPHDYAEPGPSVAYCTPAQDAEVAEAFLEAYQGAERIKLDLLELHRATEPHPLMPTMLDRSFMEHLYGMESLVRLRDYVDDHMPDDEDDYAFAKTFCQAVVISALFEHENYHDVLDIVRLFGMEGCEGEHYPHQLGKLVTDVFNTLPGWQLNGWSLNENTERLSGQAVIPQADQ